MKKAINMELQIQPGGDGADTDAVSATLQKAFEQANPALKLAVKQIAPGDYDGLRAQVYIEGEAEPTADFAAIAAKALQNSGQTLSSDTATNGGTLTLSDIHERESEDENSSDNNDSLVLSPAAAQAESQPEKTLAAQAAPPAAQAIDAKMAAAEPPADGPTASVEQATPTTTAPAAPSAGEQDPVASQPPAEAPATATADATPPATADATPPMDAASTTDDAPAPVAAAAPTSSSPNKISRNKKRKHRK